MALVYTAALSKEEVAAIIWDKQEYEACAWQRIDAAVDNSAHHPALRRCARGIAVTA